MTPKPSHGDPAAVTTTSGGKVPGRKDPMPRYSVVLAFDLTRPQLDRDGLRDELTILVESQYDVEGPVNVAVREVEPPRKGKITSGQWGANGI